MQFLDIPNLEYLADDVELRRAAAKTLKGFCLTYLPHHFPADLSDFFDEMAEALQDHDIKRLEIIGFRGCAKSTLSYSPLELVIWNDPAAINRLSIHAVQAATTAILTLPADCVRIKDIERGPPMIFSLIEYVDGIDTVALQQYEPELFTVADKDDVPCWKLRPSVRELIEREQRTRH
jgi:hypothetical protein